MRNTHLSEKSLKGANFQSMHILIGSSENYIKQISQQNWFFSFSKHKNGGKTQKRCIKGSREKRRERVSIEPLTKVDEQTLVEMSLYTYCLAGGSFVLIGAWEVLISSYSYLNPSSSSSSSSSLSSLNQTISFRRKNPFVTSISFISISVLSFFFIFDSLLSSIDALQTHDQVGFAFQLEIISIASLFLLYSIVGLLNNHSNLIPLPSSIPKFISLFAFGQEFLFFYLQRKDPNGTENRYFDLLLVPISVCIFSTLLELNHPQSDFSSLGLGVGLILHGTWYIQMGFSFFTDFMVHGCRLYGKSRGNFTVKCNGDMEYHRSKAIATLQFNCHLAFLVVLMIGLYSLVGSAYGFHGDYSNYKPLNAEMHSLGNLNHFSLASEDDDNDDEEDEDNSEITVEEDHLMQKNAIVAVSESRVNGFGPFGTHQ